MKNHINPKLAITLTMVISGLLFTSNTYAQLDGVEWTRDTENSPGQDKTGSGSTPSTSGATNNQGEFSFEISTSNTDPDITQRQEWRFDNRSGFHRFRGQFTLDPSQDNFDKVSVVQTHDLQTGPEGVFSIYQVRQDGDGFVFGVQGDVEEADNSYDSNLTVPIRLGQTYEFEKQSSSTTRDGSIEVAILRENGNQIWTHTIVGGGQNIQYTKVGAYRLTGGTGRVSVEWSDMEFWNGN